MRHHPRFRRGLAAVAGALLLVGCETLDVPDFNNGDLEDLQQNPTPGAVITAAQGLMFGMRQDIANRNDYIVLLGIIGREGYNFDAADPRFVTEMLGGPLDPGSPAFGGNLWVNPYANIRTANVVLNALDIVTGLTDEEKEGLRGFAKTIQAHDFLIIANTRDDLGAPIDVDRDPRDLAPVVSKAEVMTHIATLLDEAATHLGGAAFPDAFQLTSGFDGFSSPAGFLRFNRALRARVAVYQEDFTTAATALAGSFVDTTASLSLGVYHTFSTNSGDITNNLFDPASSDLLAHPSNETDAQAKGNGQPDDRFTSKFVTLADPVTVSNITTQLGFQIYNSLSAPVPIIKNEELILLRAEVNLRTGNLTDALADINYVRRVSGGLDPIASGTWTGMTADQRIDELLYNRRYSLMWEGHRWIDMRRFGRLSQLPKDRSGDQIFTRFPFPVGECDARGGQPADACQPQTGL